jgi:hypothetical protein
MPNRVSYRFVPVLVALVLLAIPAKANSDAPAWMHTAAARTLPVYDDKTNAVTVYAEALSTVQ